LDKHFIAVKNLPICSKLRPYSIVSMFLVKLTKNVLKNPQIDEAQSQRLMPLSRKKLLKQDKLRYGDESSKLTNPEQEHSHGNPSF